MELSNTRLDVFNMENLPLVVDVVAPLWAPSVGDDDFKRFNVEYIVLNKICENNYRFELMQDKNQNCYGKPEFLSAAFFARKGDTSKVEEWFSRESQRFPSEWRKASGMSKTYLTLMDERTLSIMNDDDIKLSLFVSRSPGAGSLILEKAYQKLQAEGWKNLYLWTDCDCNWQWYERHGYTLVQEDTYEPFSDEHENYKTYIFKKKLK